MSTLAAARADNFYFPPDHDPRKGSLNKVRSVARWAHTCTRRGCLQGSVPALSSSATFMMPVSSNHCVLQQQGQHALRERAKKLDQGILVIR